MEKYHAAMSINEAEYSPKKLLAIYGGVSAAVSLLLSVLSYLISSIRTQGGLGAMDTQAALSTAQLVLSWAWAILAPIWSAGLCYAAIGLSRRRRVSPQDLTEGFRTVRPLIVAYLWIGGQYLFRAFISLLISSQLLTFTPVASTLIEAMQKKESMPEAELMTLLGDALMPVMLTVLGLFAVVFVLITLPVFYRYRMTVYLIVDRQEPGGIRAMLRSQMMMFRRRWDLAKLDLSFWWYYVLLGLGAAVTYGGRLLPMLGIALPVSQTVVTWAFLGVGLAIQLLVITYAGPKVAVTYALRYERYLNEPPVQPPQPEEKPIAPQDLPWSY